MNKTLLSLSILGLLNACGGSGDTGPLFSPATSLRGQLIDSPVIRAGYVTSSGLTGLTDANGYFSYQPGDTVKFSIGRIVLGEGRAGPVVTPMDLVGGATSLDHPAVVKILQVLQTLDDDQNLKNGIGIADAVTARLAALPDERPLKDISDLAAGVINLAFPAGAGGPRTLQTAAAAQLHFAETLAALEAKSQIAAFPDVSNFVIGGGNKNCSSFNGNNADRKSTTCSEDWNTILAQDPAFAGLTSAGVSFESNYPVPEFKFSLSPASIDRFKASPASLFNADRKAALLTAVNARLTSGGPKTGLTFAELESSKPLFADGAALFNTALSARDFDLMLSTLCGIASPANGTDCVLSDGNIAAVQAVAFDSVTNRDKVVVILKNLQVALGSGPIKYRREASGQTATPNFRAEFQARRLAADGSAVTAGLTATLTSAEKAIVRSAFVDANPQTARKVEARSVKFLSDTASFDIYTGFVAAARAANGGKTPAVGLVTASSDLHPFADRDINFFALKSAGAEVIYLPMDGGFRQALDNSDCANTRYYYDSYANTNASGDYYNTDQIYPDLAQQQQAFCTGNGASLAAALQGLSGIFFTGGDQARHLESFVTKDAAGSYTAVSPQVALLQARFAAGQLVVAGTSAGNHIQGGGSWKGKPVPMIGGGDSYTALTAGFVRGSGPVVGSDPRAISYERGGLGFFNYGVLDSHFSRRTREGRLVRETRETGMDYGFGVDENTSLVVGRPDASGKTSFAVVGAGGVFIADVRSATASGAATGNYTIDGVKAHYLNPGDSAVIDAGGNLSVMIAPTKPLLPLAPKAAVTTRNKVQDYGSSNFLALTNAMGTSGAALGFGTTEGSADNRGNLQNSPFYSVTLSRGAATEFRGLASGRVSYTQVTLKFAPCAGACTPLLP